MKKTQFLKVSAAPLALSLALVSAPAFAQDAEADAAAAQADQATAEDVDSGEAIVVTGSLISNPNLERSNPVNVTTADDLELLQTNVAEEVLREIPGVVPSIGSAVNNGNGGASFVNLRGLGSNRNIVLLDGSRVVPGELQGRVDLNIIPLALVERMDVLTGGSSTTYGADAVSGVVNFITKRDFAGAELTTGYQITDKGDGAVFRADLTVGANFDDGRGNAVLGIGYQESDPVYQGARAFSVESIDSYSGAAGGSGTSAPSRFTGVNVTGADNANGTRQINTAGTAFTNQSLYQSYNFNPFNIFQTPFKRYNIFASARYEVTDAVEVYTRGMFSKNRVSTIVAPSGAFNIPVEVNLNNPYLTDAMRNAFCARDTTPAAGVYTPLYTQAVCDAAATATDSSDPNYRTVTTGLYRRAVEYGPRISEFDTTFFDYKFGLRGALTDTINWDVFGAYGESENTQRQKGYWLNSRIAQGLLVNTDEDGNAVCEDTSNGCVPLDVFGPVGSVTDAANAFLNAESLVSVKTTLAQARGTLSGDFGWTVPMASNPVAFAAGAEYRKYTATQESDLLSQSGDLGGAGGAAPNIDGGFDVYEFFGELVMPLVQDRPFFNDLTLEAGVRYSNYSVDAPSSPKFDTWTWKAGGSWEFADGFKLRGNYARAVRAPNIAELFNPLNTVLTNLQTDPCAGSAPLTNATLAAVCIAQGAPASVIGTIENPSAAQANVTTGGNLDLKPETSNSWTLGLVLNPSSLRGFSASIDYYNIKITDAITTPTPDDMINACFSGSNLSATNPDCTVIRRNPLTGGLDGLASTTPGLFAPLTNLGRLKTDGIDLSLNYRTDLTDDVKFTYGFNGNWTNTSKFQATPTSLNRECTGFYSVNCTSPQPEFSFTQRFTIGWEDVDVSLLHRYIHKMKFEPAQMDADIAAAIDANTDDDGNPLLYPTTPNLIGADGYQGCPDYETTDAGGCLVEEGFRNIKSKHYFDITTRFMPTENLSFTLTVQNIFNSKPKVVGNSIGSTSFNSGNVYPSTYDALGRRYGIQAKLKF